MFLGVDYYPEHWDIGLIDEDLARMIDMGVNMVRIGEFAWHLMEKDEGQFDFSFFDHVIEKVKANGMKVMFGTPTATFPAWLAGSHPDILNEDINGQKKSFGGRRQYCFNSETYQNYSMRIAEKLITHYRDEEAIVSWQIDNELGHEDSDMCYCGSCLCGFQEFLQEKYDSIDELNERWGTIFWGQTYNGFSEIPVPKQTITVHNPAMMLDWSRFRSTSLSQFALKHVEQAKRLKGDHQTVTTNLPGGLFGKWFDTNEFSRDLDFVSYDNYPVWGGLKEPISPAHLSMTLDLIRGLKKQNFWIVEELMGAQGHDVIGYLPRPNQAKVWAWHAFAHGCSNMLFFRWRGMNRGAEQYCLGILDSNNRTTRKFNEVKQFFNEVKEYEKLFDSPVKADVALLYDFDNIWSWRIQQQNPSIDFTEEVLRLYEPFHKQNTAIDVLKYDQDFSGYKVVLVPVPQLIDPELTERLEEFTKNGGTVIVSYRAGVKDKDNNLVFGAMIPGGLSPLLGIEVEESESLHEGQSVPVVSTVSDRVTTAEYWRDLVNPTTADSLYRYDDAFYNEYACVTENTFGSGKAYYIGAGIGQGVVEEIAAKAAGEAGIETIETNPGVEVVSRTVEGKTYRVIINHNGYEETFGEVTLQPYDCVIAEV
ncbi:beta-galactosidase [Rossellomorea sp. YZS02]|uniref:beta-galactosidase n=1 Tax=Rossellomorea sp. YZS02 TaxID=3097358 RepID=UPI002A12200F|nr:beta-galactosidase [Rossellomorea sp. YZS02]MDX8343113.1 beta-galactosidase [Rossellomorea sp. YZS02]